jgi:hypothetical protein
MINWRSIEEVGYPKKDNKTYLVTDGKYISTTDIHGSTHFKGDGNPTFTFIGWSGDDSCSGERIFDMKPTHWCPTDEINLP